MPLDGLDIGRYHLLRLIGSGGMGEVYLAEDTRINRQVAIKVIRGEAIPQLGTNTSQDAARLFEREAKAIARLNHSHILPLFDYGEEMVNDTPLTFMVMPYCQDGSLETWLRQKGDQRSIPAQEGAYLLGQAADALQYAHDQQLIHQDVKPSNFLIRSGRDTGLPDLLLTDFGVAKFIAANSSNSQSIRGTPSYMAPEQWEGNPVTETDQYALGIMAYQLVTGRLPFQGGPGQMMYQHLTSEPQPPSTYIPSLPGDVDIVILHALAKKPEDRFASIAAFARAFQQATAESSATVFQFTLQNTIFPGAAYTQDRPAGIDPYATFAAISQEEPRPPIITSDENTVITGDKTVISGGSTPKGGSLAVNDKIPATHGDDRVSGNQGQRSSLSMGRIILFALLALVLIAASFASYYFIIGPKLLFAIGPNTTATVQAHRTAQAQGQATANALATTNAHVSASATAQGKATATAEANPYPPNSGTLTINDLLINNDNGYGWEGGERDGGFCTFTGGAYHSNIPLSGVFHSCLALATSFADFAFEVQARVISGTTSGIVFRADRLTTHLYYFIIDERGNFFLKVYFDKNGNSNIIASGSDPAIKSDGNNLIAVVARGSHIELYVNRHLIKTLNDTSFSAGQIGVVVLSGEAAFSNARVWKL
jgi:serine/threonine protein kinase